MQRSTSARLSPLAALLAAPVVVLLALTYNGLDTTAAATETPTATDTATATQEPESTNTPRPTRTPAASPTPSPTLTPAPAGTPLPSLSDLRYYTPVAQPGEPTSAATALPSGQVAVPPPPAGQPSRAPVRATKDEAVSVEATATPKAAAAIATPPVTPTLKPAAPLPTPRTKAQLKPIDLTLNDEPPLLDVTPAGVAAGGPAAQHKPLSSSTLMVIGIGVVAAGGSWGFYYLLKPDTD